MFDNKFYIKHFFPRFLLEILLFLTLFTYFYPTQFKAISIPTIRIFQFIGLFLFLRVCAKGKLNKKILLFYGYGILIFLIGCISTIVFNKTYELNLALSKGIYILLYSFGAYLIVFLMKRISVTFSFYTLLEWMIYISLIQSIISIMFFLFPSIFEIYSNLIVHDEHKIESLRMFRLIGIGDTMFANAAVRYGIVIWGTILLYKQENSFFSRHIFFYYLIISLFCIVGIFSGRIFFLMLLMTIFYIFFLNGRKNIFLSCKEIIYFFSLISIIVMIVILYLLFTDNEKIINWAFELFLNIGNNGTLETDSTNDLQEMYLFPDNVKTWLIGDGRSTDDGYSGFYMKTDVGYIRSLFYWGLIGCIIYYFIQYKFYEILKNMAPNVYIRKYLLIILLWFYIYNLKEFWSVDQYFILYLIILLSTFRITKENTD
jgi:hypothetical protein